MFSSLKLILQKKKFPASNKAVSLKAKEIFEGLFGKELIEKGVNISFAPPNLYIKTSNSVLKNEILLNQNLILEKLKAHYKNIEIKKII